MPFVIEDFDMERYVHVDALVANFQGVFLNTVRLAELQNGIKFAKGQEIKMVDFKLDCRLKKYVKFICHAWDK